MHNTRNRVFIKCCTCLDRLGWKWAYIKCNKFDPKISYLAIFTKVQVNCLTQIVSIGRTSFRSVSSFHVFEIYILQIISSILSISVRLIFIFSLKFKFLCRKREVGGDDNTSSSVVLTRTKWDSFFFFNFSNKIFFLVYSTVVYSCVYPVNLNH